MKFSLSYRRIGEDEIGYPEILRVRDYIDAKRGERPRQGDRVRWWGNPVGEPNVYREGYVARADGDVLVIAAQICKGDSGAGLFNDRGEVVGIISAMTAEMHCQFALSLP